MGLCLLLFMQIFLKAKRSESRSATASGKRILEFCGEVNRQETRVMGLSSSEDRMIVARIVLT